MNSLVEKEATGHAHEVNLGQDTDCPLALRIHLPRHLQTIRIRQIGVRSSDGKDDTVRLGDVLEEHLSNLLLNIPRLVTDGHLGETGQIDKG